MNSMKANYLKLKKLLLGSKEKSGLLTQGGLYMMLIGVGFVFLYPILVMMATALKDAYDLINPLVEWIPTKLYLENFQRAWVVLGGTRTVASSTAYMLLIACAQTVSSALIAYGFAKFKFPLRNLLFILMIVTFIIPEQVTLMPRYMMFKSYGMLKTILPFLLPSMTGQGIKSAIFILIFYRFFRMAPKAMDEAAMVDGAGFLRIFARINVPLALPGAVVVFIFSFVWHWNETYLSDLYFGTAIKTMPLLLERFTEYYTKMFPVSPAQNPLLRMNEGIRMAATVICIVPLVLLYFVVERKLIESIDRAGITGE
jgi:multiple sugar transport system permease protein